MANVRPETRPLTIDTNCFACTTLMGYAKTFMLNNENVTDFYNAAVKTVCETFTDEYKCSGYIDQLSDIAFDQLVEHYADAEFLCDLIKQC